MKNTTFELICGRTTTHLSGCVVVSSFISAPVVGVKPGGVAAAHPVFCLSNLVLPFAHRCLLNGIALAARRSSTTQRLQAGVPTSHSRSGFAAAFSVLDRCGRISNVRLLSRIISQGRERGFHGVKKVYGYSWFSIEKRKSLWYNSRQKKDWVLD